MKVLLDVGISPRPLWRDTLIQPFADCLAAHAEEARRLGLAQTPHLYRAREGPARASAIKAFGEGVKPYAFMPMCGEYLLGCFFRRKLLACRDPIHVSVLNLAHPCVNRNRIPTTDCGREIVASLKAFLDMCREDRIEPRRQFSDRFNVRIPPELPRGHRRSGRGRGQEPQSVGCGRAARQRRRLGGEARTVALNPIAYTENVVRSFLRYQLTAYPFADPHLHAQMRELLSLDETRQTPLLKGPYVSLSRPFGQGAPVASLVTEGLFHPHLGERIPREITHLYSHQERAIRAIAQGHTTLVSTGTGSGKTVRGFASGQVRMRSPRALSCVW